MGYATIGQVKAFLFPAGVDDSLDDGILEMVIGAASGAIDRYCGRSFYGDTDDTVRYCAAADSTGKRINTGDVRSLTSVESDDAGDKTYSTLWDPTEYELAPESAPWSGMPYVMLLATPNAGRRFPRAPGSVRLTGKFGWAEYPPEVVMACVLQSLRLYKRKDAIFGVMGSADMGQTMVIARIDPDLENLLGGVKKGPRQS